MNILGNCIGILGFSIPIITELLILIDYGIYSIACVALNGFFKVLEMSYQIFGASGNGQFDKIYDIIQRAMLLAGIFALFKLSLTLINYIVNPDNAGKATQMGTTIIRKIIIAVILLISSKFIFQKLGEFQEIVFESQIIQKIVYGDNAGDADKMKSIDVAKQYTNTVWLQFFKPKANASGGDMSNCNKAYNNVGSGQAEIITLIGCHYKYFDYLPIAPFIVGIILCYYFITYSVELAIRIVKLIILEILFPIPVIMSVDLKKGDEKLKNYMGLYFGIYAQVFLRVMTLYLAFALLSLITDVFSEGVSQTLTGESNWFFNTIIIVGVFKGMKELPKLIEDAIGVKLSGGRAKSFGATLKGVIGGTTGLITGAVAGGITGGFGGALLGGLQGATNGAKEGQNAKNVGGIIKNAVAQSKAGTNLGKNIRGADGLFGYVSGNINNSLGYRERVDNKANDIQQRKDLLDKFKTEALNQYANGNVEFKDENGNIVTRRRGTVDDDVDVIAAQSKYNAYLASGQSDLNEIERLRNNVTVARNNYEHNALNDFGTKSLEKDTEGNIFYKNSSGERIDPRKNYSELSDSQRAHYDLTRNSNGKEVIGSGTETGDFYSSYKNEEKAVKNDLKAANNEKKSLKYQHATAAGKNSNGR